LKQAGQLTPFPDAANLVTVTVRSDTAFQPGDVIIISGLVGARPLPDVIFKDDYARVVLTANGPSNDHLLFHHRGSPRDTGNGIWMQCDANSHTCNLEDYYTSSELHLAEALLIESGRKFSFAFSLINPVRGSGAVSAPARLTISAWRGDSHLIQTSEFEQDGIRVPNVSSGLSAGDAKVLVVRMRSYYNIRSDRSTSRKWPDTAVWP
jgi:hypothetical protein